MVDSELVKVIDQCVKHEFVDFNDVDDINEAVDTFSDALERIHAKLRAKNEQNVRWVMNCYPHLTLCLTHLRSHPVVINNKYLFSLLIKCILWFYNTGACSGIQIKANRWAQKQIQSSVSQVSPPDECRAKELLVKKLEKSETTTNETCLREFWLKNYKLKDLIEDENIKRRIDDHLLRLVEKSPHEESSKKIAENIWGNTHKNDVETKRVLWTLHSPGLECDIISLLESQNVDICDQLFSSCGLNPRLFERVVCILFAIFRATNHHPKPIQFATLLLNKIQRKSSDAQFCCQLDPSTWLLLTDPKNFANAGSVLRTLSERITSNEQLAFLFCINSSWLRFLLRSVDAELVSTRVRLIHSPNCRHDVQLGRFFVSECPRCIALGLDSYSSVCQNVGELRSHLNGIFPSVNLDVLLDWWQQE